MTTASDLNPSEHPHRWGVLAGVWLVYFSFGLTFTALAPLVSTVSRDLDMSNTAMGSVLGAWQLIYIFAALPCGIVLDRFGPRRVLLASAIIMASSGALRALATDHLSLFLAVALFGLGGPMISIGAPKLVSLWFEGRERGLAMGIYITGPGLGGITALSLTNSVMMPAMDGDWRAVLLAYAAFVLAVGAVWFVIAQQPASRDMERRLAAEPKVSQFQIFADLMRLPAVRIVLWMSICIFFFNHGLNNWLPEILRSHGMAAAAAGYWASLPTAVGVFGSLVIPRLATPNRRLPILLVLFCAAGASSLLLQVSGGPLLGLGLVLQGIGRGVMMTVAILTLVEIKEVGSRRAGLAGGLFFSAAEIGGVLGPLSIGALSQATGGFAAPLLMLTANCGVLILLLGWLRRVGRRTSD